MNDRAAIIETVENGKLQKKFPQKVLIISDEHRGAKISDFPAYQAGILTLMASGNYHHVVLLGDNAELFYIRNKHVKVYAGLLDVLAGKGTDHWKKEFDNKQKDPYHKIKNVIKGEMTFLQEFLERYPHVTIHKVLGNHEDVNSFRNKLDDLQRLYPHHFEWNAEAIRIGDALFTHAHLPMSGKSDAQYEKSDLKDAKKFHKWTDFLHMIERPGHQVVKYARNHVTASDLMDQQLKKWDGKPDFHYLHEGKIMPFTIDWVKHVFFGHTHIKFDNHEKEGILYHNSGAVTEIAVENDGLGILEATLREDGTITDVAPVQIFKDRHFHQAR